MSLSITLVVFKITGSGKKQMNGTGYNLYLSDIFIAGSTLEPGTYRSSESAEPFTFLPGRDFDLPDPLRQQPHYAQSERRLAGAGLAHEAQGLPLLHRQRKAVHGMDQGVIRFIGDGQVLNLQNGVLHPRTSILQPRVERVPQAVSNQVQPHDRQNDRYPGDDD